MLKAITLALWLGLTAAFAISRGDARPAGNVFGDAGKPTIVDHRILYTDWKARKGSEPDPAWRAIGKIMVVDDDGKTIHAGSGVLVGVDPKTNTDVILTAGHCIVKKNRESIKDRMYFVPNMLTKNVKLSTAGILKEILAIGSDNPHVDYVNDWALVRLDRKLGDTYGYLPVASPVPDDVLFKSEITLLGYSTDLNEGNTPSIHSGDGCKCLDYLKDKVIRHSCDNTVGASGAPLLATIPGKGVKIVGLNVAQLYDTDGNLPKKGTPFRLEIANLAVRTEKFAEKVKAYEVKK